MVVGVGVAASGRTFFGTSPHFRSKPTNTLANQDCAPTTRPVTNHARTRIACVCVRAFDLESVRTRASVSARSLFSLPLATTSTASFHFESNGLTMVARKLVSRLAGYWL